jgi:TatD DNase family protein
MIDSHAHLHDPAFDDDRAEVFARAQAAGVRTMVNIGTDFADSAKAVAVANEYGIGVAVGIHPHEAIDAPPDLAARFAELRARAKALVAIGEIGLDFHYDHSPRDVQRIVLQTQLHIAAEFNLPVVFHEREAFDDFVDILRAERSRRAAAGQPALRGVIHCFTRDEAAARVYTEEFGLYLGIGGVLTFKTAQGLRDAVHAVGMKHLILETDCPYLAPVPHRGKRNEPAFMRQSAEKLAELLAMPIDEVARITTENTFALFGRW